MSYVLFPFLPHVNVLVFAGHKNVRLRQNRNRYILLLLRKMNYAENERLSVVHKNFYKVVDT